MDHDVTYWAGIAWDDGGAHACLAVVRFEAGRARATATREIDAGHSDRYGEWYAPALRSGPLRIDGQAPMPIVDATAMGAGGGGGTITTVFRIVGGAFRVVLQTTLDGSIDINSSVENPCGPPGELVSDGRTVSAQGCFEGRTRPLRWSWRHERLEPVEFEDLLISGWRR